ncbi:MAG: hydrogenase maturation nickel metallochaperone HypA [Ferruginibacter sp.]
MHELSLVMSITELVEQQAADYMPVQIESIELDIGYLSGVEIDSFEFAWKQGVKNTLLENATKHINRIEGKVECMDCHTSFAANALPIPCPSCNSYFVQILQGKEMRVKSFTIPD